MQAKPSINKGLFDMWVRRVKHKYKALQEVLWDFLSLELLRPLGILSVLFQTCSLRKAQLEKNNPIAFFSDSQGCGFNVCFVWIYRMVKELPKQFIRGIYTTIHTHSSYTVCACRLHIASVTYNSCHSPHNKFPLMIQIQNSEKDKIENRF